MDWIHCNECYAQPCVGNRSKDNSIQETLLYLTSCGHIFCGECKKIGVVNGNCKICHSKCNVIQLVHDLKPDIKEFFSEPEELISKLNNVLEFQKKHRIKLTAHRVLLESKYKRAKNEIKRLTQIAEKMYGDLMNLYKENKKIKAMIQAGSNKNKFSPFSKINTPAPIFATPRGTCSSQGSHFLTSQFQSNLVTPSRVSRQANAHRSGSNNSEKRDSFNLPASLLTPSSTISYRSMSYD